MYNYRMRNRGGTSQITKQYDSRTIFLICQITFTSKRELLCNVPQEVLKITALLQNIFFSFFKCNLTGYPFTLQILAIFLVAQELTFDIAVSPI